MNLYQKLLELRKAVPYIQKTTSGFNYVYASESSVIGLLREKMDELGLFLEISMTSLEVIGTQKDNKYFKATNQNLLIDVPLTKAVIEFTWVNCDNPEEKIIKQMIMQRPGGDCQEVGSMLTYANRYFLLKYFSIPTDKDDPDFFNEKIQVEKEKIEDSKQKKLISEEEWTAFDIYLNGNLDMRKKLMAMCKTSDLRNITHKQLEACRDYARKHKKPNQAAKSNNKKDDSTSE